MNKEKNPAGNRSAVPLTVKASVSYTICSIIQNCISLISLPLFTRMLTTEQYGQYTIYVSWAGLIMIFLTLNMAYGSFSAAMVKFEDKRDEYIASVEGICLMLSAIFLIVYLLFAEQWNKLFDLPEYVMVIMTAEILAQTGVRLWSGKKRFEYKYKSVIAVTLVTAVLAPIAAYLLISTQEEKGIALIVGNASVSIAIGSIIFIRNIIKGKRIFNKEIWKYALGFNIPLLAFNLSEVIFNQSDRIMISNITGKSDAAMYGVAYSMATVLVFILNAINNSYVPWYYEKIKEGRQSENRPISCGIAVLISLMLLCIIWYAPEIIVLVAGEQYRPAIWVVAPVAMSFLLLYYTQLFVNVEFYYEDKKSLVFASVGAAIVNVVSNALLIPVFGFVAAGYTTLFSYVVFAGSNCLCMKRILKKKGLEDNAYNYKGLLGILAGFVAAGFLGVALYDCLLPRIIITLIVFVILLLNIGRITEMLKEIRK